MKAYIDTPPMVPSITWMLFFLDCEIPEEGSWIGPHSVKFKSYSWYFPSYIPPRRQSSVGMWSFSCTMTYLLILYIFWYTSYSLCFPIYTPPRQQCSTGTWTSLWPSFLPYISPIISNSSLYSLYLPIYVSYPDGNVPRGREPLLHDDLPFNSW